MEINSFRLRDKSPSLETALLRVITDLMDNFPEDLCETEIIKEDSFVPLSFFPFQPVLQKRKATLSFEFKLQNIELETIKNVQVLERWVLPIANQYGFEFKELHYNKDTKELTISIE